MADASFKDVPELFEVCSAASSFSDRSQRIHRSTWESRYSRGRRAYVSHNLPGFPATCLTTSSTATFRELGPPDLVHVLKSSGRSGQRDVSTLDNIIGATAYNPTTARLVSLRLRSGRILLRVISGVHQLSHVQH